MSLVAADGRDWWFDVTGGFTTVRGGFAPAGIRWRALGRAHVFRTVNDAPLVLLASYRPGDGTPGDAALRALGSSAIFDVALTGSTAAKARLAAYAAGGHLRPLPGFWNPADLSAP